MRDIELGVIAFVSNGWNSRDSDDLEHKDSSYSGTYCLGLYDLAEDAFLDEEVEI